MTSFPCQPTILAPLPPHARYLVFGLQTGRDPRPALLRLRDATAGWPAVIGLGAPLIQALGDGVPGLRAFPALAGPAVAFPSTQGAVWAYLAGDDRGVLFERALAIRAALGESFTLDDEVEGFFYDTGRDLTGFEDGTENPKGDAAVEATFVTGEGPGLDGGSFVALQKYRHDMARFHSMSAAAQDAAIGRHRISNEEMPDAPPSAHVKRTAQESFDPPAFMLRRSLPWGGAGENGLYFVAFGRDLDRFERSLRRMAGLDDGIVDGLLGFTRALTGGYYWCPPLHDGRLDLSRLAL
jgi:putative iron-dependent peroxidase